MLEYLKALDFKQKILMRPIDQIIVFDHLKLIKTCNTFLIFFAVFTVRSLRSDFSIILPSKILPANTNLHSMLNKLNFLILYTCIIKVVFFFVYLFMTHPS